MGRKNKNKNKNKEEPEETHEGGEDAQETKAENAGAETPAE